MAAAVVAADRWSLMNFVLKLPHATQRHMPHAPTRSLSLSLSLLETVTPLASAHTFDDPFLAQLGL